MVDICAMASVVLGWRASSMEPGKGRGLSKRSQFLLWLLQHQPEIITVELEYETGLNDDDLMDLGEDVELAEALLTDLLTTENDAETEAARDFLENCLNNPPTDETDGNPAQCD